MVISFSMRKSTTCQNTLILSCLRPSSLESFSPLKGLSNVGGTSIKVHA